MLSKYKNQKCIYEGKQSEDMLSVRGVNTPILRPGDFLCVWMSGPYSRGGDWGLALDIGLWQSPSHRTPELVVCARGLPVSPWHFAFQVRKTQQW